ncbi:TetR/AcrR family transcriptional regulator [Streptomyces roseirectus]|uniref:TetR/AcrR family transcriptional regulator n=1 Tax=Streptomyces roseirectus TaxID=2768066 RepID=A0A7H0ISX0_9ACTN|nr:TetR/AcrR family transcriptional regulator [Streptomyces roseirectus]
MWLADKERRRKSSQPTGLDRARITSTTVRLLDAEGLDKFSMRRLAAELNVTAMSVYWYVETKDELLELALDEVYGEVPLPHADDWQTGLRQLATWYRALLVRHPWASPLGGRYLNIGPHSLEFSRAVQHAVRKTELPPEDITGVIAAVFQFVYGFGTMEAHFLAQTTESGLTPDEYYRQSLKLFRSNEDMTQMAEETRDLVEARGTATIVEMHNRDFDFALNLLLAGIEAMRQRR